MSSNIEYNEQNESYSFVSVKEKAWHGLGQIVENALTSAEAIKLANLDFEVDVAKTFAMINEEYKLLPTAFTTFRKDTNYPFAVVGGKYTPLQNTEAFDFMDGIVGSKKAIFETAGALHDGRIVFMTAKLPDYIRLATDPDDIIEKYLLLANTHDGSGTVKILFTPVRVVCNNTLNFALSNASNVLSLRHTSSITDKIKEGLEMLNLIDITSQTLEINFNILSKFSISDREVTKFLAKLYLEKDKEYKIEQNELVYTDELSTRKKNILESIEKGIYTGVGQDTKATKGTLFGVYNGISYFYQNLKEYKTKDEVDQEKKFVNNFLIGDKTKVQSAFNLALAVSKDAEILNV